MATRWGALGVAVFVAACANQKQEQKTQSQSVSPSAPTAVGQGPPSASERSVSVPEQTEKREAATAAEAQQVNACGDGKKLRVHFYNVAQALAALVDLPDGKHVLVDAADESNRPHCGTTCGTAIQHLVDKLSADLKGDHIDVLWVTHQHSDHLGGVPAVLAKIKVNTYVDNGTAGPPLRPGQNANTTEVASARSAASQQNARLVVVDLTHHDWPLSAANSYLVTPVVPSAWGGDCAKNPNLCSIALRIDFCSSSILFTGDAEAAEEQLFSVAPVSLLQVGHHGSSTSSSPAFIDKLKPSYAVISSGKPNEGMNRTYCHPVESTVTRLTTALGGVQSGREITAFFGAKCNAPGATKQWRSVPGSATLWATATDGDIVLETSGDGHFTRVLGGQASNP